MTLYELIASALDGGDDDDIVDRAQIAVVEWLRQDDTKAVIYAAQIGTGTGPPLLSISEALVRHAQEEP